MEFKDEVVAAMQETGADIMLLTETGSADEMARAALRNYAIAGGMAVEQTTRGPTTRAGGQVLLVGTKWAKLQRTVHEFRPIKADKDRVLAVEFDNKEQGAHNKLLVIGYYGYNDAVSHRPEV